MPQWRKLHTKTIDSFDINEMPDDFTRLLWVLLPLKLDCEGRGIDNPAWVRSQVFPLREDVTNDDVAAAMDWYAERQMICRYEVNGRCYFCIPTWHIYQGDTSREANSVLPSPDDNGDKEVKSESGAGQEPITTESRTDACADAEADTDSEDCAPSAAQAPAPPPPKPPKKPTKRKTSTPVPEAVKVFRANAHYYPAKAWYGDVERIVGTEPARLEFWGRVVKAWVGNGWNPKNVKSMLDYFSRNEIPEVKNGGRQTNRPGSPGATPSGTAQDHNTPTPEEVAEFQAQLRARDARKATTTG